MKCCVVLCSLLLVLLAVIFATVPLNLNNRMVLKYGLRGSVAIHTMVYGDGPTEPSIEAHLLQTSLRMRPDWNDTSITEPEQFRSRFDEMLTTLFPLPSTLDADHFTANLFANDQEDTLIRAAGSIEEVPVIQIFQKHPPNSVGGSTSRFINVIYFHGGGFVEGSASTYQGVVGGIMLELQSVTEKLQASMGSELPLQFSFLVPDYRLAPEHPLPAAVEDCVAVYRKLLNEQTDPKDIIFMGDSAGGNLAFSVALEVMERGLPSPAALVAFSPWTDLTLSGKSYTQNNDAILQLHAIELFANWAAPSQDARKKFSLITRSSGELRKLPPTIIQVGGEEILLSDSTTFAQQLREAGVPVHLDVVPGLSHDFNLLVGWIPEASESLFRVARFLVKQI